MRHVGTKRLDAHSLTHSAQFGSYLLVFGLRTVTMVIAFMPVEGYE
jgi:hypothetical protein